MNLLGVNLREISLKRENMEGEIKIKNVKNNINVVDINLKNVPVSETGKAIIFSFEYSTDYELAEPKDTLFGSIRFVGDVAYSDTKKKMDDVIKSWKKNKKIDEKTLLPVLQAALNTVNVEAIYLSNKVMLPSPVRLPQIMPQKD